MSAAPRHRARVGARSLQFRTAHILFQRPHLFGQLCAFLFQLADGGDRRFAALLLGCGGQGLARGSQQLFKFRKSRLFALPLFRNAACGVALELLERGIYRLVVDDESRCGFRRCP